MMVLPVGWLIAGEISKVFGLTLLDMVELFGLVGLFIAGITAFFLWYQIYRQSKVDSARFTIDYIDRVLEKNKNIITVIYERADDTSKPFESDRSVRILLSQLEDIIQFKNDGVIHQQHILNTLGILLRNLKKDTEIQRIIKDAQKKDKTTFELLDCFMKSEIN